jgi:hypothetical protein
MHENAARALQYYEDLPRLSGRPDLRLVETEPRPRHRPEAEPRPRRSQRAAHAAPGTQRSGSRSRRHEPPPRRRPIVPARRRQTVAPRIAGRPDRVAMWAVLLGFFLTGVAAATGHG